MSDTRVTFYLPKLSSPSEYDGLDPDADWTRFKNARAQWIPHSYVRLRQAGHAVRIANRPPEEGVVVVFAGDMRRFLGTCSTRRNLVLVCAQADRRVPEASLADVVIQHNGLGADGRRRFFIPNWPQAGLVPRDPSRGSSIRTVSYKGSSDNLHPELLTSRFEDFLESRDLQFVVDADASDDPRYRNIGSRIKIGSATAWNDYTKSDVILAIRPGRRDLHRHKPAVKLVNAWRAGVPALLGPEAANRELRLTSLDYLEVKSLGEVMSAIDRLCTDPIFYGQMVANGAHRAADFSVESITRRWEALLFSTLAGTAPKGFARVLGPITVPVRRLLRGVKQNVTRRR